MPAFLSSPLGGNFTLAELGVCEPSPTPHPAPVPYCPDLGLLQRGYSLSAGSDADSDPEGPLSPERAIQLWARQGRVKSRRSSGVSSHENSALTLTDSENDNKSDDESGRMKDCSQHACVCPPVVQLEDVIYRMEEKSSRRWNTLTYHQSLKALLKILEELSQWCSFVCILIWIKIVDQSGYHLKNSGCSPLFISSTAR